MYENTRAHQIAQQLNIIDDTLFQKMAEEIEDNGLQEIYVNTKIDDGTDIAELMHKMLEKKASGIDLR